MKLRAPFRYWGAKVRMAPWVIERLPEHDHFVEVFAGSAAVMAVKPPVAFETLNDTYGEVVNFWQVLRDPAQSAELIDMVAATPYAHSEFRDAGECPPGEMPVTRAWSFLVRMQMAVVPGRTGWSYCKTGSTGKKANKPGRWANMPELLTVAAGRFERVQVTDWDACDLIARLDAPGVLFFCDPPYMNESRPNSTGTSSGYVEDDFDHGAFLDAVKAAEHASFAITHYPHPMYDGCDWTDVQDYTSHRNIPNGDQRRENDRAVERLYLLDRSGSGADRG